VWGEKLPFGTVCGEFSAGGWVHAVAFSPSGNSIAYCAHDSTISIANGPNVPVQVIQTTYLPFVTLLYANESSLVVAGHECAPFVVTKNGSEW
jgi:actin related protein 2/3 complex, subunit 1A/1B